MTSFFLLMNIWTMALIFTCLKIKLCFSRDFYCSVLSILLVSFLSITQLKLTGYLWILMNSCSWVAVIMDVNLPNLIWHELNLSIFVFSFSWVRVFFWCESKQYTTIRTLKIFLYQRIESNLIWLDLMSQNLFW